MRIRKNWTPDERRMVAYAANLAYTSHAGQYRRDGLPYFMHVARVAEAVASHSALHAAVGLLHDVIEDTMHAGADLLRLGVPEPVVRRVLMLTHRRGEPYPYYIAELIAIGDRVAMQVKLADINDNMADTPKPQKVPLYREALMELSTALSK